MEVEPSACGGMNNSHAAPRASASRGSLRGCRQFGEARKASGWDPRVGPAASFLGLSEQLDSRL